MTLRSKVFLGFIAAHLALIGLMVHKARAADLPIKAVPQPVPYLQAFSWTGLYLGGAFGYETNDIKADLGAVLGGGSLSTTPGGFSAGAVAIVRYEPTYLPITVGAMAEIDRLFSNQSAASWLGKAGPELGYVVGPKREALLYVHGGFAYQAFDNQFGARGFTLDPKGDGWFVGVGVDYALTPWLIVGGVWDHVDITGPTVQFTGLGNLLKTGSTIDQFLLTLKIKG